MITRVPLAKVLDNPSQRRQDYGDIEQFAKEISWEIENHPDTLGLYQPPVGRLVVKNAAVDQQPIQAFPASAELLDSMLKDPAIFVELALGHRRKRAFDLLAEQAAAGKAPAEYTNAVLPIDIRSLDDKAMAQALWGENADRKDVTPLERAETINAIIDRNGWTQDQAGAALGLSRSVVANSLRLLAIPELNPKLAKDIQAGTISERQALAFLPALSLPEGIIKQRELDQLVYEASSGDGGHSLSSNDIRSAIGRHVTERTIPLTAITHRDVVIAAMGGVQSGKCDDCPVAFTYNKITRCPDSECRDLRARIHHQNEALEASAELGLLVLPEDADPTDHYNFVNAEEVMKEAKKPCSNLSIGPYLEPWGGGTYKRCVPLKDYPTCAYYCGLGGWGDCECRKRVAEASRAQEDSGPSLYELQTERRDREVIQPAAAWLAAKLEEGGIEAVRFIVDNLSDCSIQWVNEGTEPAHYWRYAAHRLMDGNSWHSDNDDIGRTTARVQADLAEYGLHWEPEGQPPAVMIGSKISSLLSWFRGDTSGWDRDDVALSDLMQNNWEQARQLLAEWEALTDAEREAHPCSAVEDLPTLAATLPLLANIKGISGLERSELTAARRYSTETYGINRENMLPELSLVGIELAIALGELAKSMGETGVDARLAELKKRRRELASELVAA